MKLTRVLTFPVVFLILEPFFIYWDIKARLEARADKYYLLRAITEADRQHIRKVRSDLYRNWLNGEPYDTVFRLNDDYYAI